MMKRSTLAGLLVMVLCAGALAITGCRSSDHDTAATQALSTYAEDVAACTPMIPASGEEGLAGAEVAQTITHWTGWDPTGSNTVFSKLLTTDSAEGLYDPIEKADIFVEIINSIQSYWNMSGTFSNISFPMADATGSVTVNTGVTSVAIPFYGGTQTVDRLIIIEGYMDDMGDFECQMAFTTGGGEEAMIVWTHFPENGEVSMFYGKRAADGLMDIKTACFADKANLDPGDDFGGATVWRGNPDEGWFAISQFLKNMNGSKVLAGGEPDGDMAFLATSGADPIAGVGEPYYLTCNIESITDGTEPAGGVLNAVTSPPLVATNPVFKYIIPGNPSCLGYLDAYPDETADILPLSN